jgi:hypothetical protein
MTRRARSRNPWSTRPGTDPAIAALFDVLGTHATSGGRRALPLDQEALAETGRVAVVDHLLVGDQHVRDHRQHVTRQRAGLRHQLRGRDHPIDEAPLAGLLGAQEVASERQLLRT